MLGVSFQLRSHAVSPTELMLEENIVEEAMSSDDEMSKIKDYQAHAAKRRATAVTSATSENAPRLTTGAKLNGVRRWPTTA